MALDRTKPTVAISQSGTENTVQVSGTVPLPTGASTSAKQDTGNTSLSSIDGKITAVDTTNVTVGSSALPSGAATAAKQPALGTAGTASADVLTVQGITSMTALKVDGSAVTQPVSAASLPLPTGAATSAKQDTAQTALDAIKTAVETIDNANATIGTTPLIRVAVFDAADTQVTSFGGAGGSGTEYTEDAAAAANPVGGVNMLVRKDTPAATVSADGDNIAQRGTDYGAAYVTLLDTGGSPVSVGGGTQYTEDAVAAADPIGNALMMVRKDTLAALTSADGDNVAARGTDKGELYVKHVDSVPVTDNGGSLTVDGTVTANLAAGTNNIGDVDVLTVPADPFGANADATVAAGAAGSISAKLRRATQGLEDLKTLIVLAAGTNAIGKLAANSGVDIGDVDVTSAVITGSATAHDAVDANNPIKVGGQARSTEPTAVADADRVNFIATLLGKQVVIPHAIPASTWNYAAAAGGLVSTTGVTAKAAAGAGIRNYVKSAHIVNSHQTISTEVVIRDGAAGTVLWRGWAQAAGGGQSVNFDPPLRGTANTLIEIAEVTATATAGVLVSLQGYTAGE